MSSVGALFPPDTYVTKPLISSKSSLKCHLLRGATPFRMKSLSTPQEPPTPSLLYFFPPHLSPSDMF